MHAKHTPGPWEVRAKGVSPATVGTFVGKVGSGLVAQAVTNHANMTQAECLATGQANARLIAAAPEIYEALRELHLKAVIGTEAERHAALDRAWAALTKAEGRA